MTNDFFQGKGSLMEAKNKINGKDPASAEKKSDSFIRFSIATETILKNIQKYKNEKLEEFGLHGMHLMYMYCLDKSSDGMTPVELAKNCNVDKAFISRVTTELKRLGYIDYGTRAEKEPKYKKRILLTNEGKRIMQSINNMINEAVERITSGISQDQIDSFYYVLSKFDENLDSLLEAT